MSGTKVEENSQKMSRSVYLTLKAYQKRFRNAVYIQGQYSKVVLFFRDISPRSKERTKPINVRILSHQKVEIRGEMIKLNVNVSIKSRGGGITNSCEIISV